jgi:hypothetical protein
VMPDACLLLGGEQISGRRAEEGSSLIRVGRGGVGDVDYGPDAAKRVRQPVPGDQVHPARTRQGHNLVAGAAKRCHDVTPNQAGTPGHPDTRHEIASFLFTG